MDEEEKIGDPWTILPIKNKKNARECTEIHFSDRRLTDLTKFEDFPNLEVIWLNNNRLKTLDGIHTNFRIKHVYCKNNQLINLDGIRKFKFLETLFVSYNQLEGLDKFLNFLSRNFAFLEYLEMQENPLAAEPHYRLRVIKALPSVRLLDQQMITIIEREKAAKLDLSVGSSKAKSKSKKKKNVLHNPYKGFSKIEKELYKEVGMIRKEYKQQEILEETKKKNTFSYVGKY